MDAFQRLQSVSSQSDSPQSATSVATTASIFEFLKTDAVSLPTFGTYGLALMLPSAPLVTETSMGVEPLGTGSSIDGPCAALHRERRNGPPGNSVAKA